MTGSSLMLRGRKVRIDDQGFISLDDIWDLASCPPGKGPVSWSKVEGRMTFIRTAHAQATGHRQGETCRIPDVVRLAARENGGSWAHPVIAASFAGFLNPKLEVEVNEVWLRYKGGDRTLAVDVRENAAGKARHRERWSDVRASGKRCRKDYTRSLADHGVDDKGYATCTNAAYRSLLGAPASVLKQRRGLRPRQSLRDALSTSELSFLAAAEALSAERIEDENPFGTYECADATRRSSERIRQDIDADRKDRARSRLSRGQTKT